MSLNIVLEDENGERIDSFMDDQGSFRAVLPRHDDKTYQCLRFIDPYGDTIFNALQMDQLIEELDRIKLNADPDTSVVIQRVRALAQQCKDEVHLYLKCYGD